MKKIPVELTVGELSEILERYLGSPSGINYAIKIIGHPGVGKSAVVRQAAEKKKFFFIDTRLAFKENIDLGGYPVPDHAEKRMIYYRPKFIPPEKVPAGYDGIVWFLDEANRAHPTVIQTLFQIITEGTCGEHMLPEKTSIVLAGNLGEKDFTTITDFDDSALDGRLAVFHLKPSATEWLAWAGHEGIHPSVVRYIALYPERLWDEVNINPNPRGWHQVSQTLILSYGLKTEDELLRYLNDHAGPLEKVVSSLAGTIAGGDFIAQVASPRAISTDDILRGNSDRFENLRGDRIPAEDILWALSGAVTHLKNKNMVLKGKLGGGDLMELGNTLKFIGSSRADTRISFFYLLLRESGLFTKMPAALKTLEDKGLRAELEKKFESIIAM